MNTKDIEQVRKLRKRDYRNKTGLTIAEGFTEVLRAISGGAGIEKLYVCPDVVDVSAFEGIQKEEITQEEFSQIAFGHRIKGALAICRPNVLSLSDYKVKDDSLFVVLDRVEKPGNLGTVIRTSDGADIDAVISCDGRTDIYNHNVVRSSIGTVFHVPVIEASSKELLEFFKSNNIKIFSASAKSDEYYYQCDFTSSSAILVGNEHEGLSQFWMEAADEHIKIPMSGISPCLNVAASAAVLIYEAHRQRNK